MPASALGLILAAAALHATWNLCAKKAGGGLPFVFLTGIVICTAYVPVLATVFYLKRPEFDWASAGWIAGSGVLKTSYSLFLQRSYRVGDFSLIYPLARGTGPFFSTIAAIALLGERPGPLAIAGAAIIVASIFFLTGGAALMRQDRAHLRNAVLHGVVSGLFIAAYTVWDRHGVATLEIRPVLYDAGTAFTQLALLLPLGLRRWPEAREHWKNHRRYVFGVALLSPVAYVLILAAMSFTPVSYVAPSREISIVIGAFLGARILGEGDGRRRMLAASGMVIGVIALALD